MIISSTGESMSHDTILLISADAELRTWLNDHVLQPHGYHRG